MVNRSGQQQMRNMVKARSALHMARVDKHPYRRDVIAEERARRLKEQEQLHTLQQQRSRGVTR